MSKQRSGGLGRGLAALIPTDERPTGPRLGDAAADDDDAPEIGHFLGRNPW